MNIPIASFFTKRRLIVIGVPTLLLLGGLVFFFYVRSHTTQFAINSLNLFQKVSKLLPLAPDTQKEIDTVNALAGALTKNDDLMRTYLILLQNNYELRPGGGFLGQYAIIKIKNGVVVSSFVEDANLLDQRISAKITPPYPLGRKLQMHAWKFRDSNFSPDFPTNAAKAEYFYRLAGGHEKFDGTIAIDADVFDHLLDLTGPVQIPGSSLVFTSDGGSLKLEEAVEKAYLGDDVPAELKQSRKTIMKRIATEVIKRALTITNVPALATFGLDELRDKNVMLHFTDPALQTLIEGVHWDGEVAPDWGGDYLMLVDANLGALKSDYYIRRSLDYTIDFTGKHPIATVLYTYRHTATEGDWRTSDYHTYLRAYVPTGSILLDRKMISPPLTDEAFNKTYFGALVDVLIGGETIGMLSYQLPDTVTPDNYRLLIQKQSGVGTIPVTVHLKTKTDTYTQTADLTKDLNLSIQTIEEKR